MKTYVKVRDFDGEYYPHVETLEGTLVQLDPYLSYELLGTDTDSGLSVISLDLTRDKLAVCQSIDFNYYKEG